jgi:hypothetical protein
MRLALRKNPVSGGLTPPARRISAGFLQNANVFASGSGRLSVFP